jgi:hypothetical protein
MLAEYGLQYLLFLKFKVIYFMPHAIEIEIFKRFSSEIYRLTSSDVKGISGRTKRSLPNK